jgi:Protein of unknown function (DUF3987)
MTLQNIETPTQPIVAEEVPQASAVEGITDEEIIETALRLLKSGKTRPEIKTALLNEYEFKGVEHEADELIDRAYEKEIEAAQAAEDYARKVAMEATDKRLEAEREARKQLVEKVFEQGRLKKRVDPDDMRWVQAIQDAEEKETEREETFDDQAEESFPECPIFSGALTDLARALYPSLPLEFKQWGLVVRWGLMRSGLDQLEHEEHLQPRFFAVLVSPPNRGKTASINESRTAMKSISRMFIEGHDKANTTPTNQACAEVENLASADSGPFLVQEFYNVAKDASERYMKSVCSDNAAKILLDPDELSDVFEKARTSNNRVSTLFIELLKLHSNNRTANGTKQTGNRSVNNAHLAVLAGTTVKKYPMLWTGTGGGADGLVSRFLAITTNAKQVPASPLPSDFAAATKTFDRLGRLAQLPGQTVRLNEEARAMLDSWWESIDTGKQSATRILEAIKQLLIVLAVTNLPADWKGSVVTVGPELVQQAIQFGNYEIAVRERLNPGDSWSNIQAMENLIIGWFRKHAGRKLPMTRNECRRGIQPQRMPGGLGSFLLAWTNCVNAGVLKVRDRTQRDNKYSL